MCGYCIVIVSGSYARYFALEPVELPELESGPRLVERGELFNPDKEIAGRYLYTDSKIGRGRAPHGGPSHGYDDHRLQHEDESDRRFARRILEKIRRLSQTKHARYVVLVASARMLGLLRQDMDIILKSGIEVYELAKDMTKFSPEQIHDYLAKEHLVPACKRPGV
jgi:protein required for attachment to host cells